ncbi:MAG: NAD(P)/FAD-dependent oxidoreductase [Pikeienuella sp.]|uniref:NAD(P)/FAD-dependent oxidoreductase n=1 Tax=Pikeienuella sp. TaxID=2831957 RepID=UPI00391A9EFB
MPGGQKKVQIVIVGGGAGGLELARKLGARYGRANHDVILIDRNRTHIWKPLLHEVAAGSLDANMDEVGYGGHAARWGYRFFNGSVERIDRERRRVICAPMLDEEGREIIGRHEIRYDWLVLAFGGVSNDFGVPGVREHALFLENREQADSFRTRLLNVCLRANYRHEQGDHESRVRIAIVGGGATGVELSAELYNAAKGLRNYGLEVFDESKLEVTLLEAGPRILPALDEELSETVTEELRALGVRVLQSTQVTEIAEGAVRTKASGDIPADLIVWAAGVKGADFVPGLSDLELNRLNQIVVRPSLQTTKDDRIFAIGDCCSCILPGSERPIPPRAQSAHQMASAVFANLGHAMSGRPLVDFVYRDKGSLVSLSRYSTVGSLMGNLVGGRMAIEGRLARLAYLSLYRLHLIAIHGWLRGTALIAVGHVNQIVRPRLKLH